MVQCLSKIDQYKIEYTSQCMNEYGMGNDRRDCKTHDCQL